MKVDKRKVNRCGLTWEAANKTIGILNSYRATCLCSQRLKQRCERCQKATEAIELVLNVRMNARAL